MRDTRVADLTVEDLLALLREQIADLVRDAVYEALRNAQTSPERVKQGPPNLPVVDVGPWPEDLTLRREEIYNADGR